MKNLMVLLKRGLNHDDDGLQSLYSPKKKRQRMIGIAPSFSGLVITSLLDNRHPSKLRLLSFKEAVASLPKPLPKPQPKAKSKTHSHAFERRILPLPLGRTPISPRRATKASTSVKAKTKTKTKASSCQKRSPQTPETISLDLDDALAVAVPRRTRTRTRTKTSFLKQSTQIPKIISLGLDEAVAVPLPLPTLPATPPQNPTTTPPSVLEEKNLSFDKPIPTPIPEVSPRRALHVAELKTRFAATIFKARHHRLFDSAPSDVATHRAEATAAVQLRRVREKQREAARIREKQREAARIALLKVEEAADGKDNMQMFKELEELCGGALHYPNGPYALDRFGLILKQ